MRVFRYNKDKFILQKYTIAIYGRIILRGIFRKWEGVVGTGWSGLRIGTAGGHL
jgi:hypothetical protein